MVVCVLCVCFVLFCFALVGSGGGIFLSDCLLKWPFWHVEACIQNFEGHIYLYIRKIDLALALP